MKVKVVLTPFLSNYTINQVLSNSDIILSFLFSLFCCHRVIVIKAKAQIKVLRFFVSSFFLDLELANSGRIISFQ